MADHDVRLSTNNLRINGIDLHFDVKVDGAVLGTLSVSEGSLDWRPKGQHRAIPIPWTTFANWAQGN
ncbi:hypothetical protein [Nocardia wallacei]|uniref:Uncharacterized protein n=1 Tax=Nocardia wallacei TaxID=480035 RepID=A0A7G1KPH4_9NOCA|nr:hypothetical protein [Nocardia wallacei]BCK57117.1 hypothetical protein NWFMUON74_48890 [Nocardia wallacei]